MHVQIAHFECETAILGTTWTLPIILEVFCTLAAVPYSKSWNTSKMIKSAPLTQNSCFIFTNLKKNIAKSTWIWNILYIPNFYCLWHLRAWIWVQSICFHIQLFSLVKELCANCGMLSTMGPKRKLTKGKQNLFSQFLFKSFCILFPRRMSDKLIHILYLAHSNVMYVMHLMTFYWWKKINSIKKILQDLMQV